MKNSSSFETFLLVFGGVLLLLHGVSEGWGIAGYLATHQITTAYASGFAAGAILVTLCYLGTGMGLFWLAWTRHARRKASASRI